MPELEIYQSQFYSSDPCRRAIDSIEKSFVFENESDYFSNLVNFSTAKVEPFQRWVRYREGFSTVLVNELITRSGIDAESFYVADPMVGSGSTIIAARKRDFDAFGVDVNPYCKLIVEAKLMQPTNTDIELVEKFIASLPEKCDPVEETRPPLSEYFPEDNLNDLLWIRRCIQSVNSENAKQILIACWFFILEACSNRKKDGNGLATRPAPVTNVVKHFKSTVTEMLRDYSMSPFSPNNKSTVFIGSACNFTEYNESFRNKTGKELGAVIFSPPYANAFDYYESYKMELLFGELYSQEDYQIHKKEQIRNYRISYGKELHCDYPVVESICAEINQAIPIKEAKTGKRDARTRLMPNMLRGYFTDMGEVISQIYQALSPHGRCYIVVDQSAYVGVIVPTDTILADIAQKIGFSVEKLIICRKAATSGQQLNAYLYLGNTLRESIICLQK